jgi:hypothetical protein
MRELARRRLAREAERTDVSYRAFLDEGDPIHRNTLAKRAMAKRAPLIICSAGFPEWKREMQFPNSTLYPDWNAVAAAGHLPDEPRRAVVIPCAPLQIPTDPAG